MADQSPPEISLQRSGKEGRTTVPDREGLENTRTALAFGRVELGEEAFRQVKERRVRKGEVLTAAEFAGRQSAKQTSFLLPYCQDVFLQGVDLEFTLDEDAFVLEIRAFARSAGPTGVEMEALTAVSTAALTVYDMCKSISKEIVITDIRLLAKTGGESGDYRHDEETGS